MVLAAADPANPYGAALPWPRPPKAIRATGQAAKAGALVVLVDGAAVVLRTRRAVPAQFQHRPRGPARRRGALAELVAGSRVDRILVERIDGVPTLESAGHPGAHLAAGPCWKPASPAHRAASGCAAAAGSLAGCWNGWECWCWPPHWSAGA